MENREAKRMKFGLINRVTEELTEEICVEILSRLPFRSIMKFKTVCRGWKEVTEAPYFRRKFMFVHRNSSSSWSITQGTFGWSCEELVGFYGCERYGLSRSLGSYITHHEEMDKKEIIACVDGLVLLKTISSGEEETYSVGNLVLNQWVQLPPQPSIDITTGLVTRVEDCVVVEYKVVLMDPEHFGFDDDDEEYVDLTFNIFSSKTGTWITKKVRSSSFVSFTLKYERSLSLNKKLHWLEEDGEALVAYDFFATDEQQQQCQVIPFPDSEKTCFRRTYTISGGFVVYINEINLHLKLWRLEEYTSNSGRWQFMQDIDLTSFGCDHRYFPMAMHPFETNIIYMATGEGTLVSIDFKAHKLIRHTKSSTYSDTRLSSYLDDVYSNVFGGLDHNVFYAPQFVLPQWMESVPPLPSI